MRYLLLLLLLSSCYTPNKAARQVSKAHYRYRYITANLCADSYPCVDSVSERVEYIAGAERVDTVTRVDVVSDTVQVTRTLTKYRTDTVYQVRTITQTDKAALERMTTAKDEAGAKVVYLQANLDSVKDGRNTWRILALCSIGVIVLAIVWWVYKRTRVI